MANAFNIGYYGPHVWPYLDARSWAAAHTQPRPCALWRAHSCHIFLEHIADNLLWFSFFIVLLTHSHSNVIVIFSYTKGNPFQNSFCWCSCCCFGCCCCCCCCSISCQTNKNDFIELNSAAKGPDAGRRVVEGKETTTMTNCKYYMVCVYIIYVCMCVCIYVCVCKLEASAFYTQYSWVKQVNF